MCVRACVRACARARVCVSYTGILISVAVNYFIDGMYVHVLYADELRNLKIHKR